MNIESDNHDEPQAAKSTRVASVPLSVAPAWMSPSCPVPAHEMTCPAKSKQVVCPVAGNAGWNRRDEYIAKIYAYYLNTLRESNALDFDDLLLKTVDLFEQSERVRSKYAEQFRFVMVDEYQDTNRPQYLLIRRLAEVHRNICVVGDPDQSIYKWRGADLRNILDFEQDFGEATIVKLERNYRSTQIILDAASAVISQNRNRKDKRLWTDRTGGARIVYFRGGDELEEADFITRTARTALADDVEATVAVLYRTNSQSRTIEDALMREGIAYKVVGGVRFYERREVKDALAYMRLVINPHDDVSLRRVINVPARGIGPSHFATLRARLRSAVRAEHRSLAGGRQASVRERLTCLHVRSARVGVREDAANLLGEPALEPRCPDERLVRLQVVVDAVQLAPIFLREHVVLLQCLPHDPLEIQRSRALRGHDRPMRQDGRADVQVQAVATRDLRVKPRRRRVQRVARCERWRGLVFDADRALVHLVDPRVERRVLLANELEHPAVLADDVVRGDGGARSEEARERALERCGRPVVDDEDDRVVAAAGVVIARRHRAAPVDAHLTRTRGARGALSRNRWHRDCSGVSAVEVRE